MPSREVKGTLSISARILVGFLLVLVAFGAVMAFSIYRMERLRQDLDLITRSYLTQLDPHLAELRTTQRALLARVVDFCEGASARPGKPIRDQVKRALDYREQKARSALRVVQTSHALDPGEEDARFLTRFAQRLGRLQASFKRNRPVYEQLYDGEAGDKAGDNARLCRRVVEDNSDGRIYQLQLDLRTRISAAGKQVEAEQWRTILAVFVLVVIAVLVSLVVTLLSRRTLRPLKILVAGTKRIGSGDYAHRVQVASRDELGLLGREFNKMAADIETREQRLIRSERMAAAGQIASHITHEIRNPLSSISLNTELLEEELEQALEGQKAEDARNICQAMQREIDRLTDITEEYLRFARLPRPHLETEDLNEILINLVSFITTELREKGVEVIQELGPRLPPVQADENQLRQAFLNLIRNAGEAMAAEGGRLTVTTAWQDGRVVVRIADTGTGISAEDLEQIFEPFFSTKTSGTGLGLALTHQIIHEHGGTIDVESAPGAGTVFITRLPATPGADPVPEE
jgi:two-component system NtrC family sensor kinase